MLNQNAALTSAPPIVYGALIRPKVGPDITGYDKLPEGYAAASWEQPTETTYIFRLEPAAKWHNIPPVNGRALTAEDVVYSMNRQVDLKVSAGLLAGMSRVTAVDARTVRLELSAPDADFLLGMMLPNNKIVAREVVEQRGDLKTGPYIGLGAWIFKEFVPNNSLKLVRNPDYFRKDSFGSQLPYADNLDLIRIADQSLAQAAFRTGQVMNVGATSKRSIF